MALWKIRGGLGWGLILTLVSFQKLMAFEPFPVVTTIPIVKDLTQEIGKDRIKVKSLLNGLENPHTYDPKPSDLIAVRKAKIFIQIGSGLEIWSGRLLSNAKNPDLFIATISQGIPLIQNGNHKRIHFNQQTPSGSGIESAQENGRQAGNPHIWLDPHHVKTMMEQITDALSKVWPENHAFFLNNKNQYFKKLDELERKIHGMFDDLTDKKIISHHPAWPYFAQRFGITIAGDIQTQPGMEPSAKHLSDLVKLIRDQKIKVIVSEPQLNPNIPKALSQEHGTRVVILSPLPGALPGTEDYLSLMQYNATILAEALRK